MNKPARMCISCKWIGYAESLIHHGKVEGRCYHPNSGNSSTIEMREDVGYCRPGGVYWELNK